MHHTTGGRYRAKYFWLFYENYNSHLAITQLIFLALNTIAQVDEQILRAYDEPGFQREIRRREQKQTGSNQLF